MPHKLTHSEVQEIRDMRLDGLSTKRITELMGVSDATVRKYCEDLPAPPAKYTKDELGYDDVKRIHELRETGMGKCAIAYYLNLGSGCVKQVLEGKRVNISGKLSTRQVRDMINDGFN